LPSENLQWLLGGFGALNCVLSIGLYLRSILVMPRLQDISELSPAEPKIWPRLTLVIPACDEEKTLEAALKTQLGLDYPELEFVLVDDRSRDRTGAIMDSIAALDERVRTVHIKDLPAGWLGKVHAMERGVQEASGELVLFSDADIHMSAGLLRKAVAYLLQEQADHLALGPRITGPGFWLNAAISTFGTLFLASSKADRVNRDDPDAAVGIGAFNLVRRATLEEAELLSWIRMEVADDVALGLRVKEHGGRGRFLFAINDLEVAWYPSLGEMIRGLEKNSFGVMGRYSYPRVLLRAAALCSLGLGPFLTLLPATLTSLGPLLGLSYGLIFWNAVLVSRRYGRDFLSQLAAPLCFPLLAWIALRSAWACFQSGGITWRGTHYPISELRAGRRLSW